jgi:hypothetical protein
MMPLNTFSYFARRKLEATLAQGRRVRVVRIHVGYGILGLCLLSAALGMEEDTQWFFPGVVVLAAVSLWTARNRGERRSLAWVAALVMAAVVGFGGQWALLKLRDWTMAQRFGGGGTPTGNLGPNHVTTQIGNLGDLKQSQEILWRLKPVSGQVPPLLRLATYNSYFRGFWRYGIRPEGVSWEDDFRDMPTFGSGKSIDGRVTRREDVNRPLDDGLPEFNLRGAVKYQSLLPVPTGARTFVGLRALVLERNSLGTVRIAPEHPVADTRIQWGERRNLEVDPLAADLAVPVNERDVMAALVKELALNQGTTAEKVAKLRGWFFRDFTYSRYLSIRQPHEEAGMPSAVAIFLTEQRKGHCEFFATATTLLLREAGVPSRYAVGFAIVEEDPEHHEWVARGTHAHAWTRVWFAEEGLWKDVDLTPPQWLAVDNGAPRGQQDLLDAWQRLREDLLIWRTSPGNLSRVTAGVAGIAVLFLGWIAYRLAASRQLARPGKRHRAATPGSPLEALEPLARRWLGERPASRPLAGWLTGLPAVLPGAAAPLDEALALHRRARFDPRGLDPPELARLAALASELRAVLNRRRKSRPDS